MVNLILPKQAVINTMRNYFARYDKINDIEDEISRIEERICLIREMFHYLLREECNMYLFSNSGFCQAVKRKCYQLLQEEIRTFPFVSQIVDKYFCADNQLVCYVELRRTEWENI